MRYLSSKEENTIRELLKIELPALDIQTLQIITHGWDSIAIDINDAWILKFPKDASSEERLRFECSILEFLQDKVSLSIPHMQLHESEYLFSQHAKLQGGLLTPHDYKQLSNEQKEQLAKIIALFFTEMHSISVNQAIKVGASAIPGWLPIDEIIEKVTPIVSQELQRFLHETMDRYRAVEIRETELTLGHFDCYGNNMAFDHLNGTLNGVFDFADVGIDDFHKDLHCPNWISPDLTLRIIEHYQKRTKRHIQIDRVMLYTSVCRFSNLAEQVKKPEKALQHVTEWHESIQHLNNKRSTS